MMLRSGVTFLLASLLCFAHSQENRASRPKHLAPGVSFQVLLKARLLSPLNSSNELLFKVVTASFVIKPQGIST